MPIFVSSHVLDKIFAGGGIKAAPETNTITHTSTATNPISFNMGENVRVVAPHAETAMSSSSSTRTTLSASSRLFELADELLLAIIEEVDELQALRNLALTCKRFQGLVEPYIYRNIFIENGSQASRLVDSLRQGPERRDGVKSLMIKCGKATQPDEKLALLNAEIALFKNLREWHVETPCCNDIAWRTLSLPVGIDFNCHGQIDYKSLFETASVQKPIEDRNFPHLKSCKYTSWSLDHLSIAFLSSNVNGRSVHLHSHISTNTTLFSLDRSIVLFHHPTLQDLHLACFDIVYAGWWHTSYHHYYGTTSLKSLSFEECNFEPSALSHLLSYPRALERLTVGERIWHFYSLPPGAVALGTKHNEFLEALSKQKSSLNYLKHAGGFCEILTYSSTDFNAILAFSELEEIDTPLFGFLHSYLGISESRSAMLTPLPKLRRLRIHNIHDAYFDYMPSLFGQRTRCWQYANRTRIDPLTKRTVPFPLDKLTLVLTEERSNDADDAPELAVVTAKWRDPLRRVKVYEFARRLREVGTRLVISQMIGKGFIAPYMYGEKVPEEIVVYDSEKMDEFGGQKDAEVKARCENMDWSI
jgi:hypothetical protein